MLVITTFISLPTWLMVRWARLPAPMVPYPTAPSFFLAAAITSSSRLYSLAGWAVMTMGEAPINMIGASSWGLSKGRLGRMLGLTTWLSNTRRNVAPSGAAGAAAWVPIAPAAPLRFSMMMVVFSSLWSSGWTRRAI